MVTEGMVNVIGLNILSVQTWVFKRKIKWTQYWDKSLYVRSSYGTLRFFKWKHITNIMNCLAGDSDCILLFLNGCQVMYIERASQVSLYAWMGQSWGRGTFRICSFQTETMVTQHMQGLEKRSYRLDCILVLVWEGERRGYMDVVRGFGHVGDMAQTKHGEAKSKFCFFRLNTRSEG